MSERSRPRKNPCPTCPYRRDVASGVWDAEEYEKLVRYDGDTSGQDPRAFGCHSDGGESLCAGWVAHRDPQEMLALRLGVAMGSVDPAVMEYETDVPLFSSGAEAAAHGLADVEAPGVKARQAIKKITRLRGM
jgi:hypothetical protein